MENGTDVCCVQELLRHANIRTRQLYTQLVTNPKQKTLKVHYYKNKGSPLFSHKEIMADMLSGSLAVFQSERVAFTSDSHFTKKFDNISKL